MSGLLKKNQLSPEEQAEIEEHAALNVLQRWGEMSEFLPGALRLVPEHVEVRSLLNPDKPGLPQVITAPTSTVMLNHSNEPIMLLKWFVYVRVAGLPSYVGGHVS